MAEGGGAGLSASADASMSATLAGIASASRQQQASENFPVAMRIIPRRERSHLMRIYTFARFVDDVGDEAEGDRLALLDVIEQDVRKLWTGRPELPPVAGLASVKADCELPIEPLLDLIEANRLDQRVRRYASFDDLLDYCRLSAAPIGRMVLCLAGETDEDLNALSDSICAGLQVLEHCQDVAEDARAGRVYLPVVDVQAAGLADADLLVPTTSPELRRVIALQVDRARELMGTGRPLIKRLRGWSRLAVTGYLAGGMATARALQDAGYDVLGAQIRPSKFRTIAEATRLMVGR
jgi:squalene synthase HpnC